MKELISSDIKETMCRVQEAAFHEEQNKTIPTVTYELPDGQEVQVHSWFILRDIFLLFFYICIAQIGSDRFKVPEILFQPTLVATFQVFEFSLH